MTRSKNFPTADRLDQKIIGLTEDEKEVLNVTDRVYVYRLIMMGTTITNSTTKTTYNGGIEISVQFTTTKKLDIEPTTLRKMLTDEDYMLHLTKVEVNPVSGDAFNFISMVCYDFQSTIVTIDLKTNDTYAMNVNSYKLEYKEIK